MAILENLYGYESRQARAKLDARRVGNANLSSQSASFQVALLSAYLGTCSARRKRLPHQPIRTWEHVRVSRTHHYGYARRMTSARVSSPRCEKCCSETSSQPHPCAPPSCPNILNTPGMSAPPSEAAILNQECAINQLTYPEDLEDVQDAGLLIHPARNKSAQLDTSH
jgi:hypothetical protein